MTNTTNGITQNERQQIGPVGILQWLRAQESDVEVWQGPAGDWVAIWAHDGDIEDYEDYTSIGTVAELIAEYEEATA